MLKLTRRDPGGVGIDPVEAVLMSVLSRSVHQSCHQMSHPGGAMRSRQVQVRLVAPAPWTPSWKPKSRLNKARQPCPMCRLKGVIGRRNRDVKGVKTSGFRIYGNIQSQSYMLSAIANAFDSLLCAKYIRPADYHKDDKSARARTREN